MSESESVVVSRTKTHLAKAGYETASESLLKYKRGSLWGSLTSFPRRWEVHVILRTRKVSENQTEVLIRFNVNTMGPLVSRKGREFWELEFKRLEDAVCSGRVDTPVASSIARPSVLEWLAVFTLAIAVAVLVGILVGRMAVEATGQESFSLLGIVASVAVVQLITRLFLPV